MLAMYGLGATPAFAHGDQRVEISWESELIMTAGKNTLSFLLYDEKLKKMLTDADIAITHTQKVHMFVTDKAHGEFHHLHPTYNEKTQMWTTEANLPVNGEYSVWTQGKLAADGDEFTSVGEEPVFVWKGKRENPVPTQLNDVRVGTEGISVVKLSGGRLVATKMVMLDLDFTRNDGTQPKLGTFLGEKAHVIGIHLDSKSLIHTHPMDHGVPNQLMLHAVFPREGDYRLWVQFIDGDILRTIPLSVKVQKKP
jgi:hypothetical protein